MDATIFFAVWCVRYARGYAQVIDHPLNRTKLIFPVRKLSIVKRDMNVNGEISSVVTVSKCFLSVGFGRFCRKKPRFSVRFRFS